jgi:dephospho-CoA kinase
VGMVPLEGWRMLTVAVTGGIACGKSSFCLRLSEKFALGEVSVFSCDAAVRSLLDQSEVVLAISKLADDFGVELRAGQGLDRSSLRELLFENSEFRGRVEKELHPRVLGLVIQHRSEIAGLPKLLLVEVPLLYEVDFPVPRDLDLAVAASPSTQLRRLAEVRGLAPQAAIRMIQSQMPVEEKLERADLAVWNDGSLSALDAQIAHLASRHNLNLSHDRTDRRRRLP